MPNFWEEKAIPKWMKTCYFCCSKTPHMYSSFLKIAFCLNCLRETYKYMYSHNKNNEAQIIVSQAKKHNKKAAACEETECRTCKYRFKCITK